MSYALNIEMPKNMQEGLANFIQMIINDLEAGDAREALLKAVDLRQDVYSKIYKVVD